MDQSIHKKETNLETIIRERRAIKEGFYNDKLVEEETVKKLLDSAIWAPTHGMRQPWRFIFVGAEQKATFAKKVSMTYPEHMQANREEYLNKPNAILVVIMEEPEAQKQWDENFGATAAMIQNFWLLAWELQLGAVWKTNPHIYNPEVREMLGVQDNEKIVGFIHLGYFDEKPITKERIAAADKFIDRKSVV